MLFTTELLVAACVGVAMAGPHHLHRHRDVHAKRDLKDVDFKAMDWDSILAGADVDWAKAYSEGMAAKTTSTPVATSTAEATSSAAPIIAAAKVKATSTTTSAAAAKTSASSSNDLEDAINNIISDVKTAFSSIKGMANSRTSFGAKTETSGEIVEHVGNIGEPQGSNMIMVDAVGDYPFTNKFVNTQDVAITVVIWNKAAYPVGGTIKQTLANLGSCIALETPALSFSLAPGASQIVAFDDETQVGWSQAVSSKTPSGAPDTTWGEANFVSTGCGYDVSSIVNSGGNDYDMAISSVETTCISDMTQNNWIARDNNPNDPIPIGDSDGSCYIPGGVATLTTKMGGVTSSSST